MQNTRISHVRTRRWVGSGVATAVVLGSVVLAAPAQAAEFTARVGSIGHNAGQVTLTGTGSPGDHVSITPSDGAPLETVVKPDRSWRAKAHVDGFGDHTFQVDDESGSPTATLRAATREVRPGPIVTELDDQHRAVRVTGFGFERGARIDVALDGVLYATTKVDRDGRFVQRISDVPFGPHRITTTERFDGAEQVHVTATPELTPNAPVDEIRVDPVGRTVHLAGRAPVDTQLRFVDASGAPWSLVDGQDWVTTTDGTWAADLAYPAADVRFMGIVAQVFDTRYETPRLVGSTTTGATIPFPVTATVAKSTPKQLVLTGSAEPGARLSFTDADGSPVTDSDGNVVEPAVPGSSEWRVTLDPRRMTGGSVTVSATGDDGPLGSVTLTYR